MANIQLQADARAKLKDWFAWMLFISNILKHFKDDEEFTQEDVEWFIDELVHTFQLPSSDVLQSLSGQIEFIIQYVIDHKDNFDYSNIMTLLMMVSGLIFYIEELIN